MLRVLTVLCLVVCSWGAADCFGECTTSSSCSGRCNLCGLNYEPSGATKQVCGPPCGGECGRNHDCFNNEFLCPVCKAMDGVGRCIPHGGPSPREARLGTPCFDDTDCCGEGTVCESCLSGKCLSKCEARCSTDEGCPLTTCPHCAHRDPTNTSRLAMFCGPALDCGAFCVGPSHYDCRNTGSTTPCPICVVSDPKTQVGKCGKASCGMKCDDSEDCKSSTEGCTLCLKGQCLKPAKQCGDSCTSNSECASLHKCPNCINNKCQKLPTQCGDGCSSNSMCTLVPFCPACIDHACAPLKCGMNCSANSQCPRIPPPAEESQQENDRPPMGPRIGGPDPTNCTLCWQGYCDPCYGHRCATGTPCPGGCDCQFSYCVLKSRLRK